MGKRELLQSSWSEVIECMCIIRVLSEKYRYTWADGIYPRIHKLQYKMWDFWEGKTKL